MKKEMYQTPEGVKKMIEMFSVTEEDVIRVLVQENKQLKHTLSLARTFMSKAAQKRFEKYYKWDNDEIR